MPAVAEQKIVQYLHEAHATEVTLTNVLVEQIAVAPRGDYRSGLEKHLGETRDHARRVQERLGELDGGANPLAAVGGLAMTLAGQALALAKSPIDLVRGSGGEEKVLKNAKDACATEALEIATYTALERLATDVGDEETAKLAVSIRGDEERMLASVLAEIPNLTDAVVSADVKGEHSFRPDQTGAADAGRVAGAAAKRGAAKATSRGKAAARQARKVPGVAQAEGEVKGAAASSQADLPIARYDTLNADDITSKLAALSQIDLAKIDAYERKNADRSTVLERVEHLRGDEPWPGYDEQKAAEITKAVGAGDEDQARSVQTYERAHKQRAGVLGAAERQLTGA